jgi:hypothetical protein
MDSKNVIIPGRGAVLLAEPGATPPDYHTVDPRNPPTGWKSLGHTSVENNVSLSKDGGETTTYDSWWEPAIDSIQSPTKWSGTANALEISSATLDLAFSGELETTSTTGGYLVPADISAVEKALLILAVQGNKRMAIYLGRAAITLGDAPSFDREALFEVPLSFSILSYEGHTMEWFHPALDKAGYVLSV